MGNASTKDLSQLKIYSTFNNKNETNWNRFATNGPTHRGQVVNPRSQIPQGQPATSHKSETPLQNILIRNVQSCILKEWPKTETSLGCV